MNLKRRLETFIRGWLPKESNLPIYQRTTTDKTWSRSKTFAVFFITGAFMGALFGALSPLIVSGIGWHVYFIIIGTTIGIAIGVVLIRMKQKEEQKRNAQKLKP